MSIEQCLGILSKLDPVLIVRLEQLHTEMSTISIEDNDYIRKANEMITIINKLMMMLSANNFRQLIQDLSEQNLIVLRGTNLYSLLYKIVPLLRDKRLENIAASYHAMSTMYMIKIDPSIDRQQRHDLLRKGALLGDATCQYNLSLNLEMNANVAEERGEIEYATKLYNEARFWLESANREGIEAAKPRLISIALDGQLGSVQDIRRATQLMCEYKRWNPFVLKCGDRTSYHPATKQDLFLIKNPFVLSLEIGVKQQHPHCLMLLGAILLSGERTSGVDKNIEAALRLLRAAANLNNDIARLILVLVYYIGADVPRNNELALSYLKSITEKKLQPLIKNILSTSNDRKTKIELLINSLFAYRIQFFTRYLIQSLAKVNILKAYNFQNRILITEDKFIEMEVKYQYVLSLFMERSFYKKLNDQIKHTKNKIGAINQLYKLAVFGHVEARKFFEVTLVFKNITFDLSTYSGDHFLRYSTLYTERYLGSMIGIDKLDIEKALSAFDPNIIIAIGCPTPEENFKQGLLMGKTKQALQKISLASKQGCQGAKQFLEQNSDEYSSWDRQKMLTLAKQIEEFAKKKPIFEGPRLYSFIKDPEAQESKDQKHSAASSEAPSAPSAISTDSSKGTQEKSPMLDQEMKSEFDSRMPASITGLSHSSFFSIPFPSIVANQVSATQEPPKKRLRSESEEKEKPDYSQESEEVKKLRSIANNSMQPIKDRCQALIDLGECYLYGKKGLEKNLVEAIKCFERTIQLCEDKVGLSDLKSTALEMKDTTLLLLGEHEEATSTFTNPQATSGVSSSSSSSSSAYKNA